MEASYSTEHHTALMVLFLLLLRLHIDLVCVCVCVCCVRARMQLGLTALHIAAWKGHSDVVQLLLQSGADPNAISHSNKTPLQVAQEESKHHCVSILTASMAKVHKHITLQWYIG